MADLKISQLTDGDPALATDEIPAARAGANVKLTAQSIADLASATAIPSDFQPAIVTGNYYTSSVAVPVGYDSASISGDEISLFAFPFWTSHDETWTRMVISVITGTANAADVLRVGVWGNGTDNLPGALVVDAGELSLGSSGEVSATISEALTKNTVYWVGGIWTTAASAIAELACLVNTGSRSIASVLGTQSAAASYVDGNDGGVISYYRSIAYGTLPDPFGTPDGLMSKTPAIWLRKV